MIFVGVDDIRDKFVTKGTRGEDAIERCFSGASKTTRAIGRGDRLTVWAVEIRFPREIFRAGFTEEKSFRFAGKAGERKEEVEEGLKNYFHFSITSH